MGVPIAGNPGFLRPDVVWFGEMPMHMDAIYDALNAADLFVAIGTSGSVYPAAGFVTEARGAGVRTCEINLEPSDNAHLLMRLITDRRATPCPSGSLLF